jgi:hypothetical protein
MAGQVDEIVGAFWITIALSTFFQWTTGFFKTQQENTAKRPLAQGRVPFFFASCSSYSMFG